MKSLEELYAFVRALREELRLAGRDKLAQSLDSALYGGSTSGEILGGLWLVLRDVRDESFDSDSLEAALDFIQSALGPPRDQQ